MIYFLSAFLISVVLTYVVRKIAIYFKVVDTPDNGRHKHKKSVALLGGIALFISFWLMVAYVAFYTDVLGQNIHAMQLVSVFFASLMLIVIGVWDDKHNVSPLTRIIFSALAVSLVILGGVGLEGITNPFGGTLKLDIWQINILGAGTFWVLADLLVFFWLMGMMYTTKILDGLDGLTTGIVLIGALMIYFLSSTAAFYQPDTGLLALILAGVCLGFLLFNFYPAKIFLGEGGGLFLGFMLGLLAIISGGKIATALLVMAIPILDLFWVIYKRVKNKKSVFAGDRLHLHFRLTDIGLSHRTVVLMLYAISFAFGVTTLVLPSKYKLLVLVLLLIFFLLSTRIIGKKEKVK